MATTEEPVKNEILVKVPVYLRHTHRDLMIKLLIIKIFKCPYTNLSL